MNKAVRQLENLLKIIMGVNEESDSILADLQEQGFLKTDEITLVENYCILQHPITKAKILYDFENDRIVKYETCNGDYGEM